MTTTKKEKLTRDAHREVRQALSNAKYLVTKLEGLDYSSTAADCALATEYAAYAFKEGLTHTQKATKWFFQVCQN